jgi:hypothetical protein
MESREVKMFGRREIKHGARIILRQALAKD